MTKEELALAVAAEMGADATADAEAELRREKTRSFGQSVVDAATIGGFIAQVAQLAIQIHATGKTPAELIAELQAKTASAFKIADEMRKKVIERIADKITGSK